MRNILKSLLAALIVCGFAAPAFAQGTVPANREVLVSLDQSISTKDLKAGDTIDATIDQSVLVSGKTVIPKGSRAAISVVHSEASGRLSGTAKLSMRITSVVVKGKTYTVQSNLWSQTGPNHNKRNVVAIGGGTAAGAVIGAIAGGGKGAAIGAAIGAGAGTVGAAATGKKDIEFPAETKLRFTTRTAWKIR